MAVVDVPPGDVTGLRVSPDVVTHKVLRASIKATPLPFRHEEVVKKTGRCEAE
jgi:hypothetical protein